MFYFIFDFSVVGVPRVIGVHRHGEQETNGEKKYGVKTMTHNMRVKHRTLGRHVGVGL